MTMWGGPVGPPPFFVYYTNMPRKILIFSLAYYPSFVSGAEGAIKDITDRIEPSDIEFHMLTLLFDKSAPRYERIGNVHVHRVGFGGAYLSKILFIPLSAIQARLMHRKHKFDATWAMMTYMLMPLTLARWIGLKVPYLLTLQDGDPYDKVFGRWFVKPALPVIDSGFRNASIIQVISSYLGTWPEKRGYKGEVIKIFNGGNPRDFKNDISAEELDELKQKLGKKENDVFLVNTARLVYQKGWDTTIKSLKLLPDNVKLLVVGNGNLDSELKQLTKELGLEDRVIFTGAVERSEVTKYRRVSDIFVMPSRSEGLGNAGLSALASRLPLVATQVGGMTEYVFQTEADSEYGKTAWVVNPDSPEEIAGAVNDILGNPDKVEVVSNNARRMVEEKFHWDAIAKDMREKVFARVLESSAN